MPTQMQKAAFDRVVERRGKSVSAAMREVGYDPTTAKNPKNLTESVGFKQLLEEAGLTTGLIVTSLVADIKAKPKKRVGELRLGADIIGLTKRDSPAVAVQVNINSDKDEYA